MKVKLLTYPLIVSFLFCGVFLFTNCRKAGSPVDPIPEPKPGCAFYTSDYSQLHSQSELQLAEFLSSEHLEYDLDGWFFFGSLINQADPSDTAVFFIEVQRLEQAYNGWVIPVIPAAVGFNSKANNSYDYRVFLTVDIDTLMSVSSNPWEVRLKSPFQTEPLIEMELSSGTMGAPGASYRIRASIPDSNWVWMKVDLKIRDNYGVINEGIGPASFFPQFLSSEQRKDILSSSDHTLEHYLTSTNDPMNCQGSYYYSLPLIDVEEFSIILDDSVHSSGTEGLLWMDYVVQSYDEQAIEAITDGSWSFYAIQFPEIDASMMVLEVNTKTGSLPVAKLFDEQSSFELNRARQANYSWPIDGINIEAVPNTKWKSPRSGNEYVMQHRIELTSQDKKASLLVSMIREDQEIYFNKENVKYEGLARVEGTIGGQTVTGQAFVELQPVGGFK